MGTANVSKSEIIDGFEKFLRDQDGDVLATTIAAAWNELAKQYGWPDRLGAHDK